MPSRGKIVRDKLFLLARLERIWFEKYRREFKRLGREIKRLIKKFGLFGVELALNQHEGRMSKLIIGNFRQAALPFGGYEYQTLKGEDKPEVKKAAITNKLNTRLPRGAIFRQFMLWLNTYYDEPANFSRITKVSDGTRAQTAKIIQRGVLEGLSLPEIAKNLNDRFGGLINRNRAVLIARTESHTAANIASEQMARSIDIPLIKVWNTADDPRVRTFKQGGNHKDADGQQREFGEMFDFRDYKGRYKLERPGDPRGPGRGIINCRCFVTHERKD